MARKDKKAIKSNLVVLLTHLLKLQFQPEQRSSGWRGSIVEHRQRLRDDFEESPSLRPHAAEVFARAYADAREQASAETGLPLRSFPALQPLHAGTDPRFQVPARLTHETHRKVAWRPSSRHLISYLVPRSLPS